jgi:hypothetical protein
MTASYEKLYPGAYAPAEYAGSVRALIEMFQEKYQVNPRARRVSTPASTPNDQVPALNERPTSNSQGHLF